MLFSFLLLVLLSLQSKTLTYFYPKTASTPSAVQIVLDGEDSKALLSALGNEFYFSSGYVSYPGKKQHVLFGAEIKNTDPENLFKEWKSLYFVAENLALLPKTVLVCTKTNASESNCEIWNWIESKSDSVTSFIENETFYSIMLKDSDSRSLFERLKIEPKSFEKIESKVFKFDRGALSCSRGAHGSTENFMCMIEISVKRGMLIRSENDISKTYLQHKEYLYNMGTNKMRLMKSYFSLSQEEVLQSFVEFYEILPELKLGNRAELKFYDFFWLSKLEKEDGAVLPPVVLGEVFIKKSFLPEAIFEQVNSIWEATTISDFFWKRDADIERRRDFGSRAEIKLEAPLGAKVYIDDKATQEGKVIRVYYTPQLIEGAHYFYDIRVEFLGKTVKERIYFSSGSRISVSFLKYFGPPK